MKVLLGLVRRRHAPGLALAVTVALVAIPVSGDPGMLATAIIVGIYVVVALPLGLLFGQAGVLSVAQASFAAVGAYTAAILEMRTEVSPFVSVVAAIAVPMIVAAVMARPILRLPTLALVIATLAFGRIVEGIAATEFTGGRVGLTGIEPLPGIGFGIGAYVTIWVAAVLLVVGYTNLVTSSRGRSLNSIRHDTTLARSVGVNVAAELSVVFVLAAGIAGAAGWFYVHYVGFLAPESLAFSFSAAVLLMVVVGGRKSVLGPVIGAIFYVLVQDYLPASAEMQNLIFGVLLAIVLIFLPGGIVSLPGMLRRGLGRRAHRPESRTSHVGNSNDREVSRT